MFSNQPPLTRFLGGVTIALFAWGILPESSWTRSWTVGLMVAVPLLLMAFTISSVHALAPLDDRSFLRTRPLGRSGGFRRVVWVHVALLAGLVVVILIHCAFRNLGWRAASYGMTAVVFLAGACMVLAGVATTLAGSRSYSAIWGGLAVVAPAPFFATLLARHSRELSWLFDSLSLYYHERPRLSGPETTLMAGVPIMALIWWLGAARGGVRTCFVLVLAWGMVAPWVWHFGYWSRIEGPSDRELQLSGIEVRWAGQPTEEELRSGEIEIDDRIEVKGLGPSESLVLYGIRIGSDDWTVGFRDEENGMTWRGRAYVGGESGRGELSIGPSESVLGKILGGTVEGWYSREPVYLGEKLFRQNELHWQTTMTTVDQWRFMASVQRFEKVAEFPIAEGVKMPLWPNGMMDLHGLERDEYGSFIQIDCILPDLGEAEGRWPGKSPMWDRLVPRIVFVGRDGRMILAPYAQLVQIFPPGMFKTPESGPLMSLQRFVIRLEPEYSDELQERYEWMNDATAHLFIVGESFVDWSPWEP